VSGMTVRHGSGQSRSLARNIEPLPCPTPIQAPHCLQKANCAPQASALLGSRHCQSCGLPLLGRPQQRSCSARCRAAVSLDRRQQALEGRKRMVAELLREALRILDDRR
jgi:predicted nucleic acid-binding Zn ribbon protein